MFWRKADERAEDASSRRRPPIRLATAQAVRDIKAFGPRGGKTGIQEAAR
jgi:hypothetical protein